MADHGEPNQQDVGRTDYAVRRLLVLAISIMAVVALLLLVFRDRTDSPRVVQDPNEPASQKSGEPPPTTPAPGAVPKVK